MLVKQPNSCSLTLPNFNLKTLLDPLPGENFSKDDFISNTITLKYYSPIGLHHLIFVMAVVSPKAVSCPEIHLSTMFFIFMNGKSMPRPGCFTALVACMNDPCDMDRLYVSVDIRQLAFFSTHFAR